MNGNLTDLILEVLDSSDKETSLQRANIVGIVFYGIVALASLFYLYRSFKLRASRFVKVLVVLILLSFTFYVLSFICSIKKMYSTRTQQYEEQKWYQDIFCMIGWFCYLEVNWLFSMQYFKTSVWIKYLYYEDWWRGFDRKILIANVLATVLFLILAFSIVEFFNEMKYCIFIACILPIILMSYALISISLIVKQTVYRTREKLQLRSGMLILFFIALILDFFDQLCFSILQIKKIESNYYLLTGRFIDSLIYLGILYILDTFPK